MDDRARTLEFYEQRQREGRDRRPFFGYEDHAHLYRVQERLRETLVMLLEAGCTEFAGRDILDVGCGNGSSLAELVPLGADSRRMRGVDLRSEVLADARRRLPAADLREACATDLPFPDESFDLVLQSTAFSSMATDETRRRAAAEVRRVLRTAGWLVWYDTVRGARTRPLPRPVSPAELPQLFPGWSTRSRRVTVLPHRVRHWSRPVRELTLPLLRWVPGTRTHLLAVLRPPPRRQG